jgi:hypothetical protein
MRIHELALIATLAVASTGCGDDGARISEPASAWLTAQVEQIHAAAAANDRAGAEAGLAQLRQQVDQFLASNDLTIAAAGPVPVADRLFLDRIARPGDRDGWQVDPARLIAVLVGGAEVREIRDFLVSRATLGLPVEAEELLRELEAGARSLKDAGLARLVECVHPDLATHLAAHPRTRDLCLRAGTHHVAVPAAKEKAFARALRQMGLVWPSP